MATRPSQGNNSNRKITKLAAGKSNEKTIKAPRNPHNGKRGFAS